jgi:hypothetical protein
MVWLCFFVLASFLCFSCGQQGNICSGSIGSNNYNLQQLGAAAGGDVQCLDTNGNTYFYNPCQNSGVTVTCTSSGNSAVCQKDTRNPARFHDCGTTNSVKWKARNAGEDQGFILDFSGGEDQRMSDIEFICDKSQGGKGTFEAASPPESPTHDYHLTYRTTFACPTTGGDGGDGGGDGGDGGGGPAISGGWIFIIILFSLIIIYIVGGMLYNRYRRDLRGVEMIPNHEFWFALPGLVIAGNVYVYQKARGLCGKSYETV